MHLAPTTRRVSAVSTAASGARGRRKRAGEAARRLALPGDVELAKVGVRLYQPDAEQPTQLRPYFERRAHGVTKQRHRPPQPRTACLVGRDAPAV
eukprot:scaffold10504_cov67-Phaeocystis_antarctica.AAC.6